MCRKKTLNIVSIILVFSIFVSLTAPAYSAYAPDTESVSIITSNTGRTDISVQYGINTHNNETQQNKFTLKHYENDILTQIVCGEFGGDYLTVIDYSNGKIINQNTIQVTDIVTKTNSTHERYSLESTIAASSNSVGSLIGHITYNTYYTSNGLQPSQRISVYYKEGRSNYEAYTINGRETDTLEVIAGAIFSLIFSHWLTAITEAYVVARSVVSGLGGSIVGKAIGIVFSEDVAVETNYSTLTGYHNPNRYTAGYQGIKRHVITNGPYYDKVFYEEYTSDNWKNNTLAYWFWCDLFTDPYPQVKSYS